MWPFNKKNRKGELRRTQAIRTPGAMQKFRDRIPPWLILIGLSFIVITSGVIVVGGQVMPWGLGQKPRQDIRVRAGFQELDEQATAQAREQARQSTPNYYLLNRSFLEQTYQGLTQFYTDLKAVSSYEDLHPDRKQFFTQEWQIQSEEYEQVRQLVTDITTEQFQGFLLRFRTSLAAGNVIEVMPEEYRRGRAIYLVDPETNLRQRADLWVFDHETERVNSFIARTVQVFPSNLQPIIEKYLSESFKPIWLFDKPTTDRDRQARFESPENEVHRFFEPGSLLVNRDQQIDKRELQLLELENRAYWMSIHPRDKLLSNAGVTALVTLIAIGLWVYANRFQPRAVHNWSRTFTLALILFAMVAMARLMDLGGWNTYATVFEVVLVALVMTIAYEARFAFVVVVALVSLLMITLNGSVSLLLTLLAAGTTVILTLDDVRTRSKLIEIATAAALMAFVVVWASQLANFQELRFILLNSLAAAGGALAAGLVVQGALPLIERMFNIATSMTLLEWCDASKPLLRRLSMEAPGTFSHSLLLGSLAESSADAIGANGLLARAGAYYHDIGKINKSKYFVENQPGNIITRHKGLSPAMSLLIIIGHVKDGMELAREYGLPRVIAQFITEHHGTTLVEYFYHLASQQPESNKETLDVSFRYPGPRPRSKETAVLMLCDGVEGATRSLAEPTVGRIEAIVHQMVKKRLEDGQFDECDITMRELHLVEESLTKSLCAFYHSRIAYPSQAAPVPSSAAADTTTTKVATGI